MKISIIIPSFNSGEFIERTLQSIIAQSYSNYEIILIDGGSTDQTLEIVERYRDRIAYFVSEKDRGQSHAINKGIAQITGDIWAWQNADDLYFPNTFQQVMDLFKAHDEAGMIYGSTEFIDPYDNTIYRQKAWVYSYNRMRRGRFIPVQPSVFMSAKVLPVVGGVDEALNYVMDYDLYARIGAQFPIIRVDEYLGCFRVHSDSKSAALDHQSIVRKEFDSAMLKYSDGTYWDRLVSRY